MQNIFFNYSVAILLGSIYSFLIKNKKRAIIIIGVLFIALLWIDGYFVQVMNPGKSLRTMSPTLNPFVCFAKAFSAAGLPALALFGVGIAAVFFIGKMDYAKMELEDERNFKKSKQGSYGTSGWMSIQELKEVLQLTNIATIDGDAGTILGIVDGQAVTLPLKSRLNKHTAIYGASGTGKSRCFVRPQILQCSQRGESIIITDPKGEIYADTALFMENEGYNVKVFNLVDPQYSDSWNCLFEVCRNPEQIELMAQTFSEVVIKNTMQGGKADHFWDNAEMNLLKALVLLIACDEKRTQEEKTIGAAYALLTTVDEKTLNNMFDKLPPTHPAKQPFGIFKQSSESVRGNVIVGLGSRLQVFQSDIIRKITTYDEINLETPATNKSAYFVIMSDQDSTLDFLSSLFFSFLFIRLVRWADVKGDGKCKVPVNFILDEFPNIGSIPDFTKKLSTIRSRDLRVAVIFQNIAQLQNRYPNGLWEEIVGNCDTQLFLGCTDQMTSEFISKRTGEMTIEVNSKSVQKQSLSFGGGGSGSYNESQSVGKRTLLTPDEVLRLPNSNALVIIRGQKVLKVDKFDYSKHPHKDKFIYQNIRDHVPEWKKQLSGVQFQLETDKPDGASGGILDTHKDSSFRNSNNGGFSGNMGGVSSNANSGRKRNVPMFSQSNTNRNTQFASKKPSNSQFAAPRTTNSQFVFTNNQFSRGQTQQNNQGQPSVQPVKRPSQTMFTQNQQNTNQSNGSAVKPQQTNVVPRPAKLESVSVDDF